ncbi:MAG: CoA activase [Oligoflexia bacterium]|nr:CoA activase [Oligoflexia bacterium]
MNKLKSKILLSINVGPVSISASLLQIKMQHETKDEIKTEMPIDFISSNKNLIANFYYFHNGRIEDTLKNIFEEIKNKHQITQENIGHIIGNTTAPNNIKFDKKYDSQLATIRAAKEFHPNLRNLLIIGGEKFSLIRFNENGEYKDSKNNTSCAAGTGSFLDQQAKRLGFKSSEELSKYALTHQGEIPLMASRCAVFAKTDLLHAQQEGHSGEAISSGLCQGLAKNIADTLFSEDSDIADDTDTDTDNNSENKINEQIVLAGGVAKNEAVKKYLSEIIDKEIIVDENAVCYSSIGLALLFIEDSNHKDNNHKDNNHNHNYNHKDSKDQTTQQFFGHYYPPLELKLSTYPDFNSYNNYIFHSTKVNWEQNIEVDNYINTTNIKVSAYFGIDIGSTSTKAMLLSEQSDVLVGFYTKTSGRPLKALQAILEALFDWKNKNNIELTIKSVATTGAGRKFIGKIINADIIMDEITAHAKAAYKLNPKIDTIFEIGGQDAKFTTLQNGEVTFSLMNNVCAAGTGSFIEEQGQKLNVDVSNYANLCMGARAPLASDCCTVFMERDINYYLNNSFPLEEILATILHSVRENYLRKVVQNGKIGEHICFQGATAKNRALIAAFEQKLNRPIFVSPYCHLTGALGCTYLLQDIDQLQNQVSASTLISISTSTSATHANIVDNLEKLYQQEVVIENEVCTTCFNHCKLKIVDMGGEKSAYGLLCGRDYFTNETSAKQIKIKTKKYENLISIRHKIFYDVDESSSSSTSSSLSSSIFKSSNGYHKVRPTIGLPSSLYFFEELPFWKKFFSILEFPTISSENSSEALSRGKKLQQAEFCIPITIFHGHIDWLEKRVDYIFMPTYLEAKSNSNWPTPLNRKKIRRQYCYYGQFATSLVSTMNKKGLNEKCLTPLIHNDLNSVSINLIVTLFQMLSKITNGNITFFQVYNAYEKAQKYFQSSMLKLKNFYDQRSDELSVVLIGRPYTILSSQLNKKIPQILSSMNVHAFFQDMVTYTKNDLLEIEGILRAEHWHYSSKMLETVAKVAKTKNVYPILVTSFKCAPDSCSIEYLKRIMDYYNKPYLIIQLDDHNSTVGYETRIEAALRSFKNHQERTTSNASATDTSGAISATQNQDLLKLPVNPVLEQEIKDKTLLIPNWDPIISALVVANLRGQGIDARLLEEDKFTILRSLQLNTGQCLPLSAITQGIIEYIDKYNLDPSKTVVWMLKSDVACNIGVYPYFIKSSLESVGRGLEKVSVFTSNANFLDFSIKTAINNYYAVFFGGYLRKLVCKLRPYEINSGDTDSTLKNSLLILEEAFQGKVSKLSALQMVIKLFSSIKTSSLTQNETQNEKTKVAIIGDFYVRDNDNLNQEIIRFIEDNGGEVVSHPFVEYVKLIANFYYRKWMREGKIMNVMTTKSLLTTTKMMERRYLDEFAKILGPISNEEDLFDAQISEDILSKFNLSEFHTGESFDNILNIFYLLKLHPEINLFVQLHPSFCCPSLITEAMTRNIEKITGVSLVTISYDGTLSSKNEVLLPYLRFSKNSQAKTKGGVSLKTKHLPNSSNSYNSSMNIN